MWVTNILLWYSAKLQDNRIILILDQLPVYHNHESHRWKYRFAVIDVNYSSAEYFRVPRNSLTAGKLPTDSAVPGTVSGRGPTVAISAGFMSAEYIAV